jgi:hypothetical protein
VNFLSDTTLNPRSLQSVRGNSKDVYWHCNVEDTSYNDELFVATFDIDDIAYGPFDHIYYIPFECLV